MKHDDENVVTVDLRTLRAIIEEMMRPQCARAHLSTEENAVLNAAREWSRARDLFVVRGVKTSHARYQRAVKRLLAALAREHASTHPVK